MSSSWKLLLIASIVLEEFSPGQSTAPSLNFFETEHDLWRDWASRFT